MLTPNVTFTNYDNQDLDGKKAIVVMETADYDAAVDAALISLKTGSFSSPGYYLIVQESMREEIEWRLRERFSASRTGALLDKMIDFPEESRFEAPKKVLDHLGESHLEVSVWIYGSLYFVLKGLSFIQLNKSIGDESRKCSRGFRRTTLVASNSINATWANITHVHVPLSKRAADTSW